MLEEFLYKWITSLQFTEFFSKFKNELTGQGFNKHDDLLKSYLSSRESQFDD